MIKMWENSGTHPKIISSLVLSIGVMAADASKMPCSDSEVFKRNAQN